LPPLAEAKYVQSGDTVTVNEKIESNAYLSGATVTVNEPVSGDLFVAGSNIVINSEIDGDVFVAGSNVTIRGKVNGSIFGAGSNVTIDGEVLGNVRLVGANITISNVVGKNAMMAGANIYISEKARIVRHLSVAGAELSINGPVDGNFEGAISNLRINNKVAGEVDVTIDSKGEIVFTNNGHVGKDFNYKAMQKADIEQGVQVGGNIVYTELSKKGAHASGVVLFWAILAAALYKIASMFVISLVMVFGLKKYVLMTAGEMTSRPWQSIGWGLVVLIVFPIACIILMVTLVGLPLGILGLALYVIGVCLAKILAGIIIGKWITDKIGWKKLHLVWSALLGITVYVLVGFVPILGMLVAFLATLWALGGGIKTNMKLIKE